VCVCVCVCVCACGLCYAAWKVLQLIIFSHFGLIPAAVYFRVFKLGSVFEKIKQLLKCASWFLNKFLWNIYYFKKNWRYIMIKASIFLIKYLTYLSDFKWTWLSFTDFWEITKYKITWKFQVWNTSYCNHKYRHCGENTHNS